MFRAPIWRTSAYLATIGTCSGAMTSVTIARPVASRAVGEHLQAVFLVALEAVGAGPRLERAAAEAGGAQALQGLGDRDDLRLALDRARAGDDGDLDAADLQAAGLDDGPLAGQLRRGPLVGGEDRQDLLDALARLEGLDQALALLADGGDHGALGAADHLGRDAQGPGYGRPCGRSARRSRRASSRRSRCPVLQHGPDGGAWPGDVPAIRPRAVQGKNRRNSDGFTRRKKPRDLPAGRSRGLGGFSGRSSGESSRNRPRPDDLR